MDIDGDILRALAATPSALPSRLEDLDIDAMRRVYEASARLAQPPYPAGMQVTDHALEANGRRVGVRTYVPARRGTQAGVLFMHGGGWVVGSIASHDAIAAELAEGAQAVVASVEYALAPESPYPAAAEDVEAAAAWFIDRAASLGVDRTRLAIAGDSAGGNLAAAYSVRAALGGRPQPFACQLLFYPVLDGRAGTPSYERNAHAPILSAAMMRWFLERYAPPETRDDPCAFPTYAASLAAQPATYIVSAGHDPLCDEAALYATRLAAAGVPVTWRHCPDLVHGFLRLRKHSARAQAEVDDAACWLRQTLARVRPEPR